MKTLSLVLLTVLLLGCHTATIPNIRQPAATAPPIYLLGAAPGNTGLAVLYLPSIGEDWFGGRDVDGAEILLPYDDNKSFDHQDRRSYIVYLPAGTHTFTEHYSEVVSSSPQTITQDRDYGAFSRQTTVVIPKTERRTASQILTLESGKAYRWKFISTPVLSSQGPYPPYKNPNMP